MCAAGCPGGPVGDGGNGGDGVERSFTANLSSDQEVPAIDGDASGSGTFTLNAQETTLSFSVTVSGLSGPVTGAHFHEGPAGTAGPIVFDITATVEELPDGTVTASGTWDVNAADVVALLDGEIYINFHTAQNPGGEARGQLELEEQ